MFSNAKFIYENSRGKYIEFSLDSPFKIYLDGVSDLSNNSVSISETNVVNQIGTTIQSQKIQSKSITINGDIDSDIENNRNIMINTIIPNDNAKFYYLNNGEAWYLDVVPINTPHISNHEDNEEFQFSMKAPYPFLKNSNGGSVVKFGSLESKYLYPQSFSNVLPWFISKKNESVISNIKYDGQYDIGMIVMMKCVGSVINPYIINTITQEIIELDTQRLQLDTNGCLFIISSEENNKFIKVVYPNGIEQNIINLMSESTTFFKIHPGDNPIRYGAKTNEDNLQVIIKYDNLKVGI